MTRWLALGSSVAFALALNGCSGNSDAGLGSSGAGTGGAVQDDAGDGSAGTGGTGGVGGTGGTGGVGGSGGAGGTAGDGGSGGIGGSGGTGGTAGDGGSGGIGGSGGTGGTAGDGGSGGVGGSGGTGGTAGDGGSGGVGGSGGTGGTAGDGGSGGIGGSGGTGGTAGDGGSGGIGGSGGTGPCDATAPQDKCPGTVLALSGSGSAPRVGQTSGSTQSLCADYDGTCDTSGGGAPDAVFRVTPDISGLMRVNTQGSATSSTGYDAIVYARTVCADPNTQLACDDAIPPNVDSITMPVTAGTSYYLFVDGWSQTSGTYQLNVQVTPPVCGNGALEGGEECDDNNVADNDGCSHLCKLEAAPPGDVCPGTTIALTGTGTQPRLGSASGSTVSATSNYTGSCAASSGTSRDVVYVVTPNLNGRMSVDLGGATATPWDAVLYAQRTCGDGATQIECDDQYDNGAEVLGFPVVANVPVYLVVDGYSGTSGTYQINVRVDPAVCGNGVLDGGEQCEDGNTAPGDGCSPACTVEPAGPADTCPGKLLTLALSGGQYVATWQGSTATMAANYTGTCEPTTLQSKDAVAQFNSGVGGTVELRLSDVGTSFDATLYARSGSCTGTTEEGCVDEIGNGGEYVKFQAPPNTNYWVFVDGYGGNSGTFALEVRVIPPGCGNGYVDLGEQCDDSNLLPGDGCSATCQFEGACGSIAETEPNPYNLPQAIPAACGTFVVRPASMPNGDADYFRTTLVEGATIEAWTFVGAPGSCNQDTDTVLSLWRFPVPAGTDESGYCDVAGYLQCEDDDPANKPCSRIQHTVAAGQGGDHVLKVHNFYATTKPIAQYGLSVTVR